ncbi:hypothetical protein [Streptomyces sp. NPDC059788]|uniref:hypothetical protein n=1 Tax=Streptomyces sp. NPDC059788 TaxID=3346948 RepID=UPI00365ED419
MTTAETGTGPGTDAPPEAATAPPPAAAPETGTASQPAAAPDPLPVRDSPARPLRRGPADPVKTLMHRHRTLCERAVDPLEIAAGLEAHGVTDRTAARFRHRDVFSLAEELYARVSRAEPPPQAGPVPAPVRRGRGVRAALHLLPGAVCAATLAAVAAAGGAPTPVPTGLIDVPSTPLVQAVVGAAGAALTVLALRLCVRHGPLRARYPSARAVGLWTCWLAGYALCGDWMLRQLLTGGPDFPHVLPQLAAVTPTADTTSTALSLTCAVVPAAWCAHWFAVRARRGLADSRCLDECASRVRPLLLAATVMQCAALLALSATADAAAGGGGAGPVAAASALGILLFLARLLARHGFPAAALAGPAAAVALEAAALACVTAARLPGLEWLGGPVEAAVTHLGPAAVPAVACALPATGLLLYALRALTGASAHAPEPAAAAPAAVTAEADRP